MDFVHCNRCLIQTNDNDNNNSYYLTQCAAIYCQQCLNQSSNNCLNCGQNQCQSVLLVNAIKSDEIHSYFRDYPISKTIKHSKFIENLEKVEQFQRNQRKKLIDGLNKQLCETKTDLVTAKSENERLKIMIQNLQNQNLITPKSNISSEDSLKQKLKDNNISFKSLFDFKSRNAPQDENMPMSPASNQSSISLVSSRYQNKSLSKLPSISGSINSRITLSSARNNASHQLSHSLYNSYPPSASSSRASSTLTPASSIMSNRFGSNNRFMSHMRPKLTRTVFPLNK